MVAAINAALEKVKASGEYNTIYKKWFGVSVLERDDHSVGSGGPAPNSALCER